MLPLEMIFLLIVSLPAVLDALVGSLSELSHRRELGALCEKRGYAVGIQVGVNDEEIIAGWPSCKNYSIVSFEIINSSFNANSGAVHSEFVHRRESSSFLAHIADNYFDFIYIGSLTDHCETTEYLHGFWPKLKRNGIIAGQNFVTAYGRLRALRGMYLPRKDWSLCYDKKRRNEGAVRGAVEEFAALHNLKIFTTQKEKPFPSWVLSPEINSEVPAQNISSPEPYQDTFKLKLNRIWRRSNLSHVCEEHGFRTGAELGVKAGNFAVQMLENWPSCTRYLLVDLWAHQQNYSDRANVNDEGHLLLLNTTKTNLQPYANKTVYMKNYTILAALTVPDDSLDFIYLDARHDYCGVKEDLEAWWPKLKVGGIMAGHDYLSGVGLVRAQKAYRAWDDWAVCGDGSVHEGLVKGAVDEFAKHHRLHVFTTSREGDGHYVSWMFNPKT